MPRYDRNEIERLVPLSENVSDLLRKMGRNVYHSSTITLLGRRIKSWGIDTSHFDTKKFKKGLQCLHRRDADVRLVLRPEGSRREEAYILRRCLLQIGREYKCEMCGQQPTWNGKVLVLQVDHINGIRWDDRPSNLRFTCPNCHSQTENYGVKNAEYGEVAEPALLHSARNGAHLNGVAG